MPEAQEQTRATPGPWEIWGGTRIVTMKPARSIAEVVGRSPEEGQANARLIAAAPDLLAALKAAQPLIGAESGGHPFLVAKQIRDAIKLAEGH
jgi:hypothetical protein